MGTVNASEAMNLVPNGLTETRESPHPTIWAQAVPTDHIYHNTPNLPTSLTGPSGKQPLTCASINNTPPTSAMPITVPQSSRNKRPRGDTADPCTNAPDQTYSNSVTFHTPIVHLEHTTTVPSSQGQTAPVRATFADVSTKLLQCLERNYPSKRRYTRSSTLKDHVKRHYTTSGTPMGGETRKSPSFMARAKEKEDGLLCISSG